MLDSPASDKPRVTKEDIERSLLDLGLPSGSLVLVHSSMRSFGYVEGGAEAVIDGVKAAVGPEGTVVMPSLTFNSFQGKEIDLSRAPSETGLVTETLRHYPQALRSVHPTSSAVAWGPLAKEIVEWHHDTPCDLESPYGKVYTLSGLVLFLGASFHTNTLFHVAEEIVSPEYLGYHIYRNVRVTTADGRTLVHDFRRYNCFDRGYVRHLDKMEPIYRTQNAVRETQIGSCTARLLKARQGVDIACDVLRSTPEYFLS